MKYILFVCAVASLSTIAAASSPRKDFKRVQSSLSVGQTSFATTIGNYSDPGLSFNIGYYAFSKLSLNANYSLTASTSGSSNMNGFGMAAKYYFYNTETTFNLEDTNRRIKAYDRFFSYAAFHFLDRDIRTSKVTLSYSGFGVSLGAGHKLNDRNAIGIDLLMAQMKTPTGSEGGDSSYSYFSFFYSYLF